VRGDAHIVPNTDVLARDLGLITGNLLGDPDRP
jgi:hypothetical protein